MKLVKFIVVSLLIVNSFAVFAKAKKLSYEDKENQNVKKCRAYKGEVRNLINAKVEGVDEEVDTVKNKGRSS